MDKSEKTTCNDSFNTDFELMSNGDMEAEEALFNTSDMRKDSNTVVDNFFLHKIIFNESRKTTEHRF